nr:hypothetical protein [Rhizobium sp. Root1203]
MSADRDVVLITGLAAVVPTVYSALFGVTVWIVIVGALGMIPAAATAVLINGATRPGRNQTGDTLLPSLPASQLFPECR